jgi:hypothetical protein
MNLIEYLSFIGRIELEEAQELIELQKCGLIFRKTKVTSSNFHSPFLSPYGNMPKKKKKN